MPATPAHEETLLLRASALKDAAIPAAIDRGCSMTKIVFVPKDASPDGDFVPMRSLTFPNEEFEDALEKLAASAKLPKEGKLHVTGIGCDAFGPKIREILGLETVLIPEFLTLGAGVYLTINNLKPETAFHPDAPHDTWSLHDQKLIKEWLSNSKTAEEDDEDPNKLFPAVVCYVGSGACLMYVDEEGKFKMSSMTNSCGKSFMGLANVMLGTCDYNEIMALAATGTRTNVDYVIKDITQSQDLPNYGKFPSNQPSFSYGKASHSWWDREKVSRADLAAALVFNFATGIWMDMHNLWSNVKTKRFYLAGNFTRAEVVRSFILEANTVFPPKLDIRFVSTGSTGAIGALLLGEEDTVGKWTLK